MRLDFWVLSPMTVFGASADASAPVTQFAAKIATTAETEIHPFK